MGINDAPLPEDQIIARDRVLQGIEDVSRELSHDGISKDRNNQQQGYKFRGIDDCLNALSTLLPRHHIIIVPNVLSRESVERQTKTGGTLFYVTVKVRFNIISTIDGSQLTAEIYGEAMDSADKATNKAMSAAYKYAVLLTFCIPTEGENDADAVTHDVQPTTKDFAKKFPEQAKKIQAKIAEPTVLPTQAEYPSPAPLLPTSPWVVPFGRDKGKPVCDVSEGGLDYLLAYYNGKLNDPANTTSRYREEWEEAILSVRAEMLARFPQV